MIRFATDLKLGTRASCQGGKEKLELEEANCCKKVMDMHCCGRCFEVYYCSKGCSPLSPARNQQYRGPKAPISLPSGGVDHTEPCIRCRWCCPIMIPSQTVTHVNQRCENVECTNGTYSQLRTGGFYMSTSMNTINNRGKEIVKPSLSQNGAHCLYAVKTKKTIWKLFFFVQLLFLFLFLSRQSQKKNCLVAPHFVGSILTASIIFFIFFLIFSNHNHACSSFVSRDGMYRRGIET